jgi:hypothetical protein
VEIIVFLCEMCDKGSESKRNSMPDRCIVFINVFFSDFKNVAVTGTNKASFPDLVYACASPDPAAFLTKKKFLDLKKP